MTRAPARTAHVGTSDRHEFAFALARQHPMWALTWLQPEESAQLAALLLHADAFQAAASLLSGQDLPDTPDIQAMRSALAAGQGRYAESREYAAQLLAGRRHALLQSTGPLRLQDLIPPETRHSMPTTGPLVSVVMPAYNAAQTIACSIRSVLRQRYQSIELILVDDGSSDDTSEIARSEAGADTRLQVIRQSQRGAYGARNAGIRAAHGQYVTFLDADDVMLEDRIERQLDALQATSAAAAVSRLLRLDECGRFMSPRVYPLIRHNVCSLFVRAAALATLGPFDEVQAGADAEFENRINLCLGPGALHRQRELQVVASWRAGSLTRAPGTGILDTQSRRSRIAYRESWMRLHAQGVLPGQPVRTALTAAADTRNARYHP